MDNSLKQDFTRRLSQCNSGGMIVIIYEIGFAYMHDARKAYESDNHDEMKASIRKAQKVLDELIGSLNFAYEISNNLYSLYMFCKNELARVLYENRLDGLEEAEKIMRRLYHSFAEAAKSDTSAPIMSNTQQIYAGMTYGRNQLNENDMNYDNQRGFLV
ncbi:MAG: flagellar protein FliS [Agathobacter sp.]|nr:flagellar protein FliS [Agathobacter sp.]